MSKDIYIAQGLLMSIERSPGDVTGIPPESSLIDAAVWAMMCAEAGGEAALIASLGVRDERQSYG